jgi:glycine cleavage system pyridoxal-binding protein P
MAAGIDDGWDRYCATAARARLLHVAATFIETGGAKGQANIAVSMEHLATILIKRVNAGGNGEPMTEAEFIEILTKDLGHDGAGLAEIVRAVKARAKTLRGQLDLFEGRSS